MALFADPFDALASFQRALDAFRSSDWLTSGPSGGGGYPPLDVFRRGEDFVIIAEVPGIKKADIEVHVRGHTIRLSGTKSVTYPEKASLHRREPAAGKFDRTLSLPIEIDPDGVKAEVRHGILVIALPRAERDKPKSIAVA
jgi:HSP20 family protein